MIGYEYTEFNRLSNPHGYMYSSFQGSEFIDSYFIERLKKIKKFQHLKEKKYKSNVDFFLYSKAAAVLNDCLEVGYSSELDLSLKSSFKWKVPFHSNDFLLDIDDSDILDLSSFNIKNELNTESLLVSILDYQLNKNENSLLKIWIDRLVQRFEVTKKLYESYPYNLSKGEGNNDILNLYWLFALSLTLFYDSTKNIKYLSTLLKITDLLCSLDVDELWHKIPIKGLLSVLVIELLSIKLLAKKIDEVNFDFT
jgi:hypothetical protein